MRRASLGSKSIQSPRFEEAPLAKNNTITLYDLQLASGCTISPFVWATKYALAHTKGLIVQPDASCKS